jgi:hypothetical protein
MEFWPEFMASSGGREFVAGGVGGMAGVLAGHPLDTLRVRLQQPPPPPVCPGVVDAPGRRPPSAARLLRGILRAEGPAALYRGMAAPLAAVAFQVSAPCIYSRHGPWPIIPGPPRRFFFLFRYVVRLAFTTHRFPRESLLPPLFKRNKCKHAWDTTPHHRRDPWPHHSLMNGKQPGHGTASHRLSHSLNHSQKTDYVRT